MIDLFLSFGSPTAKEATYEPTLALERKLMLRTMSIETLFPFTMTCSQHGQGQVHWTVSEGGGFIIEYYYEECGRRKQSDSVFGMLIARGVKKDLLQLFCVAIPQKNMEF